MPTASYGVRLRRNICPWAVNMFVLLVLRVFFSTCGLAEISAENIFLGVYRLLSPSRYNIVKGKLSLQIIYIKSQRGVISPKEIQLSSEGKRRQVAWIRGFEDVQACGRNGWA